MIKFIDTLLKFHEKKIYYLINLFDIWHIDILMAVFIALEDESLVDIKYFTRAMSHLIIFIRIFILEFCPDSTLPHIINSPTRIRPRRTTRRYLVRLY